MDILIENTKNNKTANSKARAPYTIAVCSGKGGVGKSVITANLSYILSEENNLSVLVWDANSYFPNQHLIFGVEPPQRVNEVYEGRVSVQSAIYQIKPKLYLLADLPASGTIKNFNEASLFETYKQIIRNTNFDIILIDCSAGASLEVLQCCAFSDMVVIIVTDEPTSLLDAYGLIKILINDLEHENISILVNNVIDFEDAKEISTKLNLATEKFLNINFNTLGYVPYSRIVRQSILQQELFTLSSPEEEVSKALAEVAKNILKKIEIFDYY